jgi:hypothetical protein
LPSRAHFIHKLFLLFIANMQEGAVFERFHFLVFTRLYCLLAGGENASELVRPRRMGENKREDGPLLQE